MLEFGNRIFFLPLLLESQEQLTGGQASPLFLAVCVLWKAIVGRVVVLNSVMMILCIILWRLLVKNTRKLNEINEQRGKITLQQKERYKKGARVKMDELLVTLLGLVFIFVVMWFAAIPVTNLQLYYGVFKIGEKIWLFKKRTKKPVERTGDSLSKIMSEGKNSKKMLRN